jgi:hypothetical protein
LHFGVTAKKLVFCVTAKAGVYGGKAMGRAGASTLFFYSPRCVSDWAALPFFIEQATTRWDSEYVLVF